MSPNPSLWLRAKEIVGDALELPAADRAAMLEARCGGDAALLAEVRAFLHAASDTADFLSSSGAGIFGVDAAGAIDAAGDYAANLAGKHFGAYHLLREIGRGGMSVVYLAERADGAYQQNVAVKLMLSATATDAAKRVGRERQTLAALNHPNIARLIDGGASNEGIPYLVMDYVDGERIDDWCNAHNLDVTARVKLAVSVCEAVQHAHQQLIVHRDIKPANILMTKEGVPKLLDFGVARLLESATAAGAADITQAGALLFTPRYASPEQVRGLPVSVSTDVYGLGVLLYEILAGSSPFINISSQAATSAAAAMRAVLEDECRPASKVAEEFSPPRADALRGELDLILGKACARDANERYATVALLTDDLQRWLRNEPISVRRPSVAYRTQKFVARHKAGSALALVGVIAICAGIAGTVHQKRLAEERYAQALALAGKVTTKYYDAIESLPGSTAVRKDITADGIQFLDQLSLGAKGDPTIMVELASGYVRLAEVMFNGYGLSNVGDRKGADSARERADKLLTEVLAANPQHHGARVLRARLAANTAAVLGVTGRTEEALKLFDRSIADSQHALALRADGDAQFQLARAYVSAAQAALSGKLSGREYLNKARAEYARWAADHPTDPNVVQFNALLIRTEYREAIRAGDWQAALKHGDAEIALMDAELEKRPDNAVYWQHQSIALLNTGVIMVDRADAKEGVARMRRAMALTERIIANDPVNYVVQGGLARMHMQLGRGLAKQGLKEETLAAFSESIRRWETLAKRDLANYQVMQMGEAYWYYFTAAQKDKPANARPAAQALLRHAEKHAAIFAKPPAADWVAAAQTLLGK